MKYDFSGYATKNDLVCSDNRIIRHGAFKECDGEKVPLVWQHSHNDVNNVLGHAVLENREDGVYAYGYFNPTPQGENAKMMVQHGDITAMSIYANGLEQRGYDPREVLHGCIKEVSLVLSPANPGAYIDNVVLNHSGVFTEIEDEVVIGNGNNIELYHADDAEDDPDEASMDSAKPDSKEIAEPTIQSVLDAMSDKKKKVLYYLVGMAADGNNVVGDMDNTAEHAEESEETVKSVFDSFTEDEKTVLYYFVGLAQKEAEAKHSELCEMEHADDMTLQDVVDGMTDEKRQALHYMVGLASQNATIDDIEHDGMPVVADIFDSFSDNEKTAAYYLVGLAKDQASEEIKQSDEYSEIEGDFDMYHNVFENDAIESENTLSHAEITEIFNDAQRFGSLKEAALQHGITNIDYMFPDSKTITNVPEFVARQMEWVTDVMGSVNHTPFSRVKSVFANITADEARAKGYVKTNQKTDEVFSMLKRETLPQTIYKKQSLDRDDVVDITDFDVVAWLKSEMRMMLDEEIARAILVGDGRSTSSNDKIKETNIRPIWKDADFYTIKAGIAVTSSSTEDDIAKAFIKKAVKARKDYKGSGSPVLYVTEDMFTTMMLLENTLGERLYKTEAELAAAMRVAKIVAVPVMENQSYTDSDSATHKLQGIVVNLKDYNVGADKGGAVSMFDDFDIDYNKQKYLIETRISGALTKPYSAIAIETVQAAG